MPSEQVFTLDDLKKGPYFLFLYYRNTRSYKKTLRSKLTDLRDGPGEEQKLLAEIRQEGGEPTGIDITDSDGHFYRMHYEQ